MSSASDSLPSTPLAEAGNDPGDPNQPIFQDKDTPPPPAADPTNDMDHDLSDNDSVLSDVDEAQFEDFDPANINIDERPIAVDEDNINLIGRHKRKRDGDGADGEGIKKRKKEGRREKPKKSKKKRDGDDDAFSGGEELEGKRTRKKKAVEGDGEKKERRKARQEIEEENEEELDEKTRKSQLSKVCCIG